jgi:predicted NBD/HSP70 family sugar kinase
MILTDEHKKILYILKRQGPVSRKNVAEECGISLPKATSLIVALQGEGLIEPESGVSTGGRIPQILQIRRDLFYSVGIDVGTEFVRVAIFDMRGGLLKSVVWNSNIEVTRVLTLRQLSDTIERVCADLGISITRIKSLGIAITGIVQEKEGRCLSLRNTPLWKGLDVVDGMRRETGIETVMIMDSVRSMAVAEEQFGAARGLMDFVVFNIGIGLGAGIVVNGRILTGDRGTNGEFGHMHIRPSDELCVCGNYGCLEATASGWAMLKRCKEAIINGVETAIGDGHDPSELSVRQIIQAADAGDKVAVMMLVNMAEDLALGIGSVINILNPQKVILAGGTIRNATKHMLEPLIRGVKAIVIPWLQQNIAIEVSQIGEFDAAMGVSSMAAGMYIERLENVPAL